MRAAEVSNSDAKLRHNRQGAVASFSSAHQDQARFIPMQISSALTLDLEQRAGRSSSAGNVTTHSKTAERQGRTGTMWCIVDQNTRLFVQTGPTKIYAMRAMVHPPRTSVCGELKPFTIAHDIHVPTYLYLKLGAARPRTGQVLTGYPTAPRCFSPTATAAGVAVTSEYVAPPSPRLAIRTGRAATRSLGAAHIPHSRPCMACGGGLLIRPHLGASARYPCAGCRTTVGRTRRRRCDCAR